MKAALVRISGDFLAEALHLPKGVYVSNVTLEPLKNSEFILRLEGDHPSIKEVALGASIPFVTINYTWQHVSGTEAYSRVVKTEIR
jgi:hypothetical protein